jgi:hypothetical protein
MKAILSPRSLALARLRMTGETCSLALARLRMTGETCSLALARLRMTTKDRRRG